MMQDKLISAAEFSAIGLVGSAITALFGGWSDAMTTLLIFMCVDFISGLFVAITCRSDKTKTGGLNSQVCFRGLVKKIMMLLMIIVAVRFDLMLPEGSHYCKDGTCIALILSEAISILENVGKFIAIPAPIRKAIDILKAKSDSNDSEDKKNDKRN